MKGKIAPLFIYILITLSTSYSQLPDTIIIKTERVKGFGPFKTFFFIHQISHYDKKNPFFNAIPEIKGIPDNWDPQAIGMIINDNFQFTYQAFHSGKISEVSFNNFKEGWDWDPQPSEYSKNIVGLVTAVAYGFDNNQFKIKADRNNNYDLSDDDEFTLPEKSEDYYIWTNYHDSLLTEITTEYYDGNSIKTKNTWLYIEDPFQFHTDRNKPFPELFYAYAEHNTGEFALNGKEYVTAVLSDELVYRNNYYILLWDKHNPQDSTNRKIKTPKGGYITLDDTYYNFLNVSIDGSTITLIKDRTVSERGGSQVGLKALDFIAETIEGKQIQLRKLEGNYVFLDFWGTWCPPCREEIPALKAVYEEFNNKNFKLIGIANDNLETLKKYVEDNDVRWDQIIQEKDKPIIKDYLVPGYPTTFLIDPSGEIIAKNINAKNLRERLLEIFKEK